MITHCTTAVMPQGYCECNFGLHRLIATDSNVFFLLFFSVLIYDFVLFSDDLASFIHISFRIFPETHKMQISYILVYGFMWLHFYSLYLLETRMHVVLHLNPETLWVLLYNWSCLLMYPSDLYWHFQKLKQIKVPSKHHSFPAGSRIGLVSEFFASVTLPS